MKQTHKQFIEAAFRLFEGEGGEFKRIAGELVATGQQVKALDAVRRATETIMLAAEALSRLTEGKFNQAEILASSQKRAEAITIAINLWQTNEQSDQAQRLQNVINVLRVLDFNNHWRK